RCCLSLRGDGWRARLPRWAGRSAADRSPVDRSLGRPGSAEFSHRARHFQQLLDPFRRLGALHQPLHCLGVVDVERRRFGTRVVGTDDLDEPAVAGGTAVGGDDAIVRLLGLADSGEAQLYCHTSSGLLDENRTTRGYQLNLGKPPGIAAMLGMARPFLPFFPLPIPIAPIFFIIFCISLNCFTKRLTSPTVVPLPLAMRVRRLPLMTSGLRRSAGVMERMMASTGFS